jgi:hypothetical protein
LVIPVEKGKAFSDIGDGGLLRAPENGLNLISPLR